MWLICFFFVCIPFSNRAVGEYGEHVIETVTPIKYNAMLPSSTPFTSLKSKKKVKLASRKGKERDPGYGGNVDEVEKGEDDDVGEGENMVRGGEGGEGDDFWWDGMDSEGLMRVENVCR